MVAYSDLADWRERMSHKGMCSVLNGPAFKTLKRPVGYDRVWYRFFKMKAQVNPVFVLCVFFVFLKDFSSIG